MSETADVEALREKVDRYLREDLGSAAVDEAGDFMIRYEDTVTWIRPTAWTEGRTLVRVWSITNVDMPVTAELAEFLVVTNAKLAFGGFRLNEHRPAVVMGYSLLGDYLNRAELQVAVGAVTGTAQQFAGEIKQRFGGKLFVEA